MDREPAAHESRAGQPWDASYQHGPAPWEIGGPQPTVVRLAAEGVFSGTVLDAGCGNGDNGLHIAALGLRVVGVDAAETAIARAQQKALATGADADFRVGDAMHLERLGERFDTVLDSALFHCFEGEEQSAYTASLARVTQPGARVHVLCFSVLTARLLARQPSARPGPHPVSEDDLRSAFSDGWTIISIEPDELHTRLDTSVVPAWLTTVERA